MNVEIELKYSLDEELARQLLAERQLANYALTQFHAEIVTDVYYDTPDHRVARAGYALRLRRKGNQTMVQLKSLTPATGAWHERQELHIPTASPTDPDRWPDTPAAHFLRDVLGDAPLHPLFTVHQQRHEAQVLDDSGKPFGLLSLDQVRWEANGHDEEAWEMEIELMPGGDETALRRLDETLQQMTGLHSQAISKYARGMALIHN